ncbi:hypothetical protein COCNU_16G003250 [Cocos nucifera]|uniref:Uncharacterized protein n=1 Tax=Cocos nucifera TaxID=13894 RepID=A0A8K0IY64_COCNU|nr:hypothetical protein COCNU_16G003250 [Cocos nucifera]
MNRSPGDLISLGKKCGLHFKSSGDSSAVDKLKELESQRCKKGESLMDLKPKLYSTTPNGNSSPKPKTMSPEIGDMSETQEKGIIMEGLGSVAMYDQWVAPPLSGRRPKPRHQHGSALLQEKMYIFGGSYNGRYLNDFQASRGGQSASLVGTRLVMFGGENAKRSLFDDLHILDLETMTWNEVDAV